MLERVDRLQLAVTDRGAAARTFAAMLGAETIGEDAVAPLAARRTTLRAGRSFIELLAPDGSGPVAEHLTHGGDGLFAAGFASGDLDALRERLVASRVAFAETETQLFLEPEATGGHGLRCVVSAPAEDAAPVGLVSALYEVTNLVADHAVAAGRYAQVFGLDPSRYCPIESAEYGYRGVLTMFDPEDRLDRIECITPYDLGKTMGRFMRRRGPSLYMAFMEAPDPEAIRVRVEAATPGEWTAVGRPPALDSLFIHPKALCGLLLGISRPTVAWSWSGHPERVVPRSAPQPHG
jgi:hypothetical protein